MKSAERWLRRSLRKMMSGLRRVRKSLHKMKSVSMQPIICIKLKECFCYIIEKPNAICTFIWLVCCHLVIHTLLPVKLQFCQFHFVSVFSTEFIVYELSLI